MTDTSRLIIANIGWSEGYDGTTIKSDHGYVIEQGQGAEAFNFKPGPDGLFYGYIRGSEFVSEKGEGWTIVFVSSPGSGKRLRIVGWYENARLDRPTPRPEYDSDDSFPRIGGQRNERYIYSAVAPDAYLVPINKRTEELPKGHRLKTGGFYFASGREFRSDDAEQAASRLAMTDAVAKALQRLKDVALRIEDHVVEAEAAAEEHPSPLTDPDLRRKVDERAMAHVRDVLDRLGFKTVDHSRMPVSYDIHATRGREEWLVEVKGTHKSAQSFFISRNEFAGRMRPGWRLAVVTDALGEPREQFFTAQEMADEFDIKIHSYVAVRSGKK